MRADDRQHLADSLRSIRATIDDVRELSVNDGRILLAITSALSDFGGANTATELQRVHYNLLSSISSLEHVSKELKDEISYVENYDDSDDDSDDESDENDDQK